MKESEGNNMSEAYVYFKSRFRRRKAEIDAEIERRFDKCVRPTDIMCATWYIKQTLDSMYNEIDIHILCENTLSRRERRTLHKYIDILNDSYWDRLYNIAGKEGKN